jgi:hypothetical protein
MVQDPDSIGPSYTSITLSLLAFLTMFQPSSLLITVRKQISLYLCYIDS